MEASKGNRIEKKAKVEHVEWAWDSTGGYGIFNSSFSKTVHFTCLRTKLCQ